MGVAASLVVAGCSAGSEGTPSGSPGTGGGVTTGGQNGSTGGAGDLGGSGGTVTTLTGGAAAGGTPTTTASWVEALFGCEFAWGAPYYELSQGSDGTLDASYLDFVSTWAGQETNAGLSTWSADAGVTNPGTGDSCRVCEMVQAIAATDIIPVFYTYVIGGQACSQAGYCDCNNSTGDTLCTQGAQWIRDNRGQVVNAYAQYAKMLSAKFPEKPMIWWLEGDYHQYAEVTTQSSPLTYPEAGELIRDITNAIKSNQPGARVGVNHAPWITDAQAQQFWSNMPNDILDLIWVQGAGDSATFPNSWGQGTANFAWLHQKTGLPIMAETSYGAPDRWTTTAAVDVNARIASGVVSVLINFPKAAWSSADDFGTKTQGLSSLDSTCN